MHLSLARFAPLIILASCTQSAPEPARGPQTAAPLPRDDWRRQLVGTWIVEFRLDSVSTSGTFVVRDSTVAGWGDAVQTTIDVQFDALLGRPMSCYDPRPTATGMDHDGKQVRLTFTPTAADCGFSAYGAFFGDSLIGAWDESSFAGPSVTGRFRMVRRAR